MSTTHVLSLVAHVHWVGLNETPSVLLQKLVSLSVRTFLKDHAFRHNPEREKQPISIEEKKKKKKEEYNKQHIPMRVERSVGEFFPPIGICQLRIPAQRNYIYINGKKKKNIKIKFPLHRALS